MKLFALLAVAVSLVLVGCGQQSSTETPAAKGSNAAPATSNAPAAPATK